MRFGKVTVAMVNADIAFGPRSNENSSRMHVFYYPKIEAKVKSVAEELGIDHPCNDILFGDATVDDKERIRSALDSEDAILGSGDWVVKLGISLFYSTNLSHSTLYIKQMAYNCVIYSAFGRMRELAPSKKVKCVEPKGAAADDSWDASSLRQ
ncbi:hypothetical protein Golob_028107 [Gossypium lobatum]|uniref:Uncharacterized protein n=1 Tax=Gossypium lobatum TaxID=34289 RepID=A0A7J8NL58_9ROSI|nr:hypothetical protein [Gossypium lobatum]